MAGGLRLSIAMQKSRVFESRMGIKKLVKSSDDFCKSVNQFIEQKDRSATYIDMHEIHVEIV